MNTKKRHPRELSEGTALVCPEDGHWDSKSNQDLGDPGARNCMSGKPRNQP